jgi:hypothetical protein
MRYFVLNGLLPSPTENGPYVGTLPSDSHRQRVRLYKKVGQILLPQGEKVFFNDRTAGRLSVLVFDLDRSLFLIKAASQRKAYSIANCFRAVLGIYTGNFLIDHIFEFLVELDRPPRSGMNYQELVRTYKPPQKDLEYVDTDTLRMELQSGPVIRHDQVKWCCGFMRKTIRNPNIAEALLHLEQSHYIISGFMTGSYYHFHYRWDRRFENKYLREKKYFESRTRYDLAFVSAFRSIESILGKTQIKRHEIKTSLSNLDSQYGTHFSTTKWVSHHEVFSRMSKFRPYEKVITHFLDLRNAVAAHANPKPPFILNEDQLFEIQKLAESMIVDLIKP